LNLFVLFALSHSGLEEALVEHFDRVGEVLIAFVGAEVLLQFVFAFAAFLAEFEVVFDHRVVVR
jgi:hypothetical protein